MSKLIPSGAQTYSKMPSAMPDGAPALAVAGRDCYIYGDDDRRYIDFVSGLGAVILGHQSGAVNAAIFKQLQRGISFPVPTALEEELAATLNRLIPCAESVRFAKNGADATAAAVRVARAATGRESILRCGYHGYQDWCIRRSFGPDSPTLKGVPEVDTHEVAFNDLEALAEAIATHRPAAFIVEPILAHPSTELPAPGYLAAVRVQCTRAGVVLIFDEVVTGFRCHIGGAQTLYGVTPDLACFGKALANGMPLSAVVGRWNLMREIESGAFFSTTAGGEALSLAAAIATVSELERHGVPEVLGKVGKFLTAAFEASRNAQGFSEAQVAIKGYPQRPMLVWEAPAQRKAFLGTLCRLGVLTPGYLNLMYAHAAPEATETVVAAFAEAFRALREGT